MLQADELILHAVPSTLPSNLEHYKNSLFFIEKKCELYYINFSSNYTKIEIPVLKIPNFRLEHGIDANRLSIKAGLSYSTFVTRENLETYFGKSAEFLSTYYSLDKILQTKSIDLENIEYSDIEIDEQNKEVVKLSLLQDDRQVLTKFSLRLQEGSADLAFFKNLRQLNIGAVQELIEQKAPLSQVFP